MAAAVEPGAAGEKAVAVAHLAHILIRRPRGRQRPRAAFLPEVHIVLMGHFAARLGIPKEKWIAAMERTIRPQFLEMNKKAFELGYAGA